MSEIQGQVDIVPQVEFKPVEVKGVPRKSVKEMVKDMPGFKPQPGKLDHMGVPTPHQ